jgi:hypothetical protein
MKYIKYKSPLCQGNSCQKGWNNDTKRFIFTFLLLCFGIFIGYYRDVFKIIFISFIYIVMYWLGATKK